MVGLWIETMPRIANRLNDKQIKSIAANKPSGLYPVGGVSGLSLHIRVNPTTGKRSASWILRIKIGDKRHSLGLGGYDGSLLTKVRGKAEQLQYEIKFKGLNPFQARAESKVKELESKAEIDKLLTFKQVGEKYIEKKESEYKSYKQIQKLVSQFENYVYPYIGHLLIKDVELSHIESLLKEIWSKKYETANRTRIHIGGVFNMAIAGDLYTKLNPARWKGGLAEFLTKPEKVHTTVNREALSVSEAPKLYNLISSSEAISAKALSFIILTASRYGEVSKAEWSEIDLKAKIWTKPEQHIKGKVIRPHRVPLSKQAISILNSLSQDGKLIFPSPFNRPLSDVAITKAHRKHKFTGGTNNLITTHGFRSTFKDWASTLTNYSDHLSEIQLHHIVGNEARNAYARDDLLEKRRQLLTDWGNYCQKGKKVGGDNVRAIGA